MNPAVDFYFEKSKWPKELELMRKLALDCGLTEELKWGSPCYTYNKSNIVLIHEFKTYCAFLFFKGALLADPKNILIRQSDNVQAARQIRFTSAPDIVKLKTALKSYIYEAIEIEKAGLKVAMKQTKDFAMPEEFKVRLEKNKSLKKAFSELTPGRQRGYLLHFSSAKQPKTREARIDKAIEPIMNGKGFGE